MTHDGIKFTADKKIVPIPAPADGQPHYVYFGRVCDQDKEGAIPSLVSRDGVKVYAKPIPCEGHSKSNMMYGPGKTYLMVDGRCYVAKA